MEVHVCHNDGFLRPEEETEMMLRAGAGVVTLQGVLSDEPTHLTTPAPPQLKAEKIRVH